MRLGNARMTKIERPICYDCEYRRIADQNHNSACTNWKAKVVGSPEAVARGKFSWPQVFDPLFLIECDGFKECQRKSN